MVRTALTLAVVTLASPGCSVGGDDFPSPVRDASTDPDRPIDRFLRLASPGELHLAVETDEMIAARLVELDGETPIPDATVSFSVVGPVEDSGLARLSVTTDGDGIAENTVFTGRTSGDFSIQIDAEGAEPLLIEVHVSRTGFGTLSVLAPYDGRREVTAARLRIVRDESGQDARGCDGATPSPGDPELGLPGADVPVSIVLPAHDSYVLLARAVNRDLVVARACIQDFAIAQNETREVTISFRDEPLLAEGEYPLTAVGTDAPDLTGVMDDAFDERMSLSGGADADTRRRQTAEFLLATLDRSLRANPYGYSVTDGGVSDAGLPTGDAGVGASDGGMDGGMDAGTDSGTENGMDAAALSGPNTDLADALLMENDDGSLAETLSAKLADTESGPLLGAAMLRAQTQDSITEATLQGRLTLTQDRASWVAEQLRGASIQEGSDAPAVSFDASEQATSSGAFEYDVETDTGMVEGLSMSWPWGELASRALFLAASSYSADPGGDGDRPELAASMGCTALSATLAELALDTSGCDMACTQDVCERALSALLAAGQEALLARDAQSGVDGDLSLRFRLVDDNDDLAVESLVDSRFAGR